MRSTEMVTHFKLKEDGKPVTVSALMRALNAHLRGLGLEPEDREFSVAAEIAYARHRTDPRLPESYRWPVAFTVNGASEGYYIHVGLIINDAADGYTNLGIAKTFSPDNAYAIVRETQRFLLAAAWWN